MQRSICSGVRLWWSSREKVKSICILLYKYFSLKKRTRIYCRPTYALYINNCFQHLQCINFPRLPWQQIGCLRTMEIYSLLALEAGSLKWRWHQDCTPSDTCRKRIPPCLFLASGDLSAIFGLLGVWLHHFYPSLHGVPFVSLHIVFLLCMFFSVQISPFCKNTSCIRSEPI